MTGAGSNLQVAFIGLGTMGEPMARCVLGAGFALTVHNRTRAREEALAAAGASRAATPADAAANADVIITMVSDTPDVEGVLFGPNGVTDRARPDTVVIDMSTISAPATRTFAARLAQQGIHLVDAPVSGGSEGAQQGTLTIMAGGDPEIVERITSVLDAMGSRITHVGPVGSGQLAKAVNQVIVGGFYLAVAEGLALGTKCGVDMERTLEAIGAGACRSWVLEHRASHMLHGSFPLGFRLALHLKDERIALETAADAGLNLPLSELVASTEARLVDAGFGDEDVSALARFSDVSS